MNKITKILCLFLLVAVAGGLYAQSNLNQISKTAMAPEMVYRVLRDLAVAQKSYVASSATLASTTTKVSWTGGTEVVVDGVPSGVLAASNTVLTGSVIPTGYYCRYLVWTTAAGTYGVTQGRSYKTDTGEEQYPPAPVSCAVFGGVKIYAKTAAFTPGTTPLATDSITTTLYNLTRRPITFSNLQPQ
jgi:hypothetical protein